MSMMESLSRLWKKSSLSESQGMRLIVEEIEDERDFFLAVRFYTGWGIEHGGDSKNSKVTMADKKMF